MELKQCPRCKKFFQYISGAPICLECKTQEEKEFTRVKEYLKENPKATLANLSEDLEIPVERITKFLKEGRLEVAPNSGIALQCEQCGRPITSGRYCKNCTSQLENDLKGSYNELKEKGNTSSSLMRFLKDDEQQK